jgi:hypothetical protein
MGNIIPLMQQELLRQHGIREENFETFYPRVFEKLAFFKPHLAVLLQPDLFNEDVERVPGVEHLTLKERKALEKEMRHRTAILAIRDELWVLLHKPISQQLESFIELTQVIKSLLFEGKELLGIGESISKNQISRLGNQLQLMLKNVPDESMRNVLVTTVQYLMALPETLKSVPRTVLTALRDVQKILQMEESALSKDAQEFVSFLFLRIARISGNAG